MGEYIGVITLEKELYCKKEVSGFTLKTKIASRDVLLIFPSIPDTYNPDPESPNLEKGDLVMEGNFFKNKVNWGMVMKWPEGIFSVNALLCVFAADESSVAKIYEDFPRWKEKLDLLRLIHVGDYITPEQKLPAIRRGGGFDDGLQVFSVKKGEPLRYVSNCRSVGPINLHFVQSKEAYSTKQIADILTNAGSEKEIALAYELLITAYQALERHDLRSAVILGGTAVEQAILNRMRREYSSNTKFKRAKRNPQHSTLNGRFKWLQEKNIIVPISDYKKAIVDVRNDAAHDGITPSYIDAKQCLEKCKVLIETYIPNVLDR